MPAKPHVHQKIKRSDANNWIRTALTARAAKKNIGKRCWLLMEWNYGDSRPNRKRKNALSAERRNQLEDKWWNVVEPIFVDFQLPNTLINPLK